MIFDQYRYEVTPWLRSVQRILLGLIVLGIILLATQTFWVPSLVSYLLQQESTKEEVSVVEEVSKTPLPDGVKSRPATLASSTATSSLVSDVLPNVPAEAAEEVVLPPKTIEVVLPPKTVTAQRCVVGGCSGQLCTDDPSMISTCEYRPEYACYASATCARQETGECGWTETAELRSCLVDSSELR